jgi:6-phosphogluconolactonase
VSAPRLEVVATGELAGRAATEIGDAIRNALSSQDRCAIALSRGSPGGLFARLAAVDLDWSAVDVFQVDERAAPHSHADRNLTLIDEELRGGVAGDGPCVHAMPVDDDDLDAAADRYADELEGVCGRPPVLDVVHLGLGEDGHTASLLPGDPVLGVRDRWVAATNRRGIYRRLTLTYPVLEQARRVVFVVAGEQKAEALAGVLAGDASMPAGRLQLRDAVIFADAAAASASR